MKKAKFDFKKVFASREISLLLVLLVLCVAVSIVSPSFLSFKNISEILKNNTVTMIMALGMMNVLLIGGIDISVAATLALSGMTMGILIKKGMVIGTFPAMLLALAIGTLCGLIVGLVISKGKVLAIIATMGCMYIFRGLAYIVANDEWAGADALGTYKDFALGELFGLSYVVYIMIACYIIFFIMMKWTKFGRMIYAVGSNREAAQISGINVSNVELMVYVIMGFLSGLGGALTVSIYASAQPNMSLGLEMDIIAACVIGGVSMTGGRGSVGGTLLGALILAAIAKALPLVGIDSLAQNTVKGVIILVVVILNVITQRAMDKKTLKGREM